MPSRRSAASVAASLVLLTGCGPAGPDLGEVTGTVTLDGKPVPAAYVTFSPEAEGGSTSAGMTDAQGNYTLGYTRDRRGAMIGKHKVTIRTEKPSAETVEEAKAAGQPLPEHVPLPGKYAGPTGGLTADVKPGDNKVDFPLTSK